MRHSIAAGIVAATLVTGVTIGAAEPSRNLWVGVLQDDLLVPVASLVNGRWTFLDSSDDGQRRELYEAEGFCVGMRPLTTAIILSGISGMEIPQRMSLVPRICTIKAGCMMCV